MRQVYPSNITREQFEVIRYILESARKATCPRKVDIYEVFCAILYIVKEGCTWRGLPHDFPRWKRVYDYFQIWGEESDSGKSMVANIVKTIFSYNKRWLTSSQNRLKVSIRTNQLTSFFIRQS